MYKLNMKFFQNLISSFGD